MIKTKQISKKMTRSVSYSLLAGLFFFILPLACNGQNGNNNLKPKSKTLESHIRSAEQTGISQPPGQPRQYVPNEDLVKFNSNTNPQTIKRIITELKLETIREFRSPNLFLMKITDDATVETIIQKLKTNQAVKGKTC